MLRVWSLRKRCWYSKPEDSVLADITDMSSDKDLMCHIWHLQLIFDKRQQLGQQADQWSRRQFIEYVLRSMQDDDVKATMFESMHKVLPDSQKGYVNLEPNPDNRDLGEPEDEDTQRIKMMKQALFEARAMKKYLKKKHGGFDSSESDAPSADDKTLDFGMGEKIAAKSMPRANTPPPKKSSTASAVGSAPKKTWKPKKKEDTSESEPEPASSSATRPAASAGRTAKAQTSNKAPAPKRETSRQAQDLFRDAEAARNVYTAWSQEFSNIQSFAHPGEKFPCTNVQDCECNDAMFWCHKCGSGYCLQCRYDGLTCDHAIAHYSVDTDPDFLPDSIASAPPSSNWTGKPEIPQFEDCLGTTKDMSDDECILVLQGRSDSCDDMVVPSYKTGVSNRDVFRLGLSEVRVAVFHLSSFGWRSAWQEGCDNWLHFLTAAIAAQVDFITGDGNLFAQRNFKDDRHTDYKSSILIDLLERLLGEINPHRSGMNQITYNLRSSIQAGAYIRAMRGENVTNADCMIMISLSYGKQSQISLSRSASHRAAADGVVGSGFSDEVMLQDVERPKYLQNIDLGLKDSDQAAHSPLVAIAKLFCQRNLRVRTEQSDNRRRGRQGRRGQQQPQYQQQDDEEEEVEVEETEEENDPVGRLRSTTPSSGARLHGQEGQAKAAGRYENPNRNLPVTPPKTPPAPPPRRRERSETPTGRNTQRRTDRPATPRRPPSRQRSWYQQQQDQYQYYNQQGTRSAPSAPAAPSVPTPPPPPAPVRARPYQRQAQWGPYPNC
eukprot:s1063_g12.t1